MVTTMRAERPFQQPLRPAAALAGFGEGEVVAESLLKERLHQRRRAAEPEMWSAQAMEAWAAAIAGGGVPSLNSSALPSKGIVTWPRSSRRTSRLTETAPRT